MSVIPNGSPRRRPETRWALLFVWVTAIFFSSTTLAGRLSDVALSDFFAKHLRRYDTYDLYHNYHLHFFAEKCVHLSMFIGLAILLWGLLPEFEGKWFTVLLCGTLVGCLSELAQTLFPNRDPTLRDALINCSGTAMGTAVCFTLAQRQKHRRHLPPSPTSSLNADQLQKRAS